MSQCEVVLCGRLLSHPVCRCVQMLGFGHVFCLW